MAITVKTEGATRKEATKILKILRSKFREYHNETEFYGHCSRYGTLQVNTNEKSYSTGRTSTSDLTINQFLSKYGPKQINLKGILCL